MNALPVVTAKFFIVDAMRSYDKDSRGNERNIEGREERKYSTLLFVAPFFYSVLKINCSCRLLNNSRTDNFYV